MAVPVQTPYIEYIANGSTNNFALEFDCENQDHLIVLVDDIEPVVGTWSLSGGAVVFGTAPTIGKKITIQRNTPFRRDGDFQSYDNSFRPPGVNKGFDKIWLKLQELGVADWILSNRIDALKAYVDDRDDELRAYLMEEIRKQGVALDQLDDYYNYLMQRLAEIAVNGGWVANFVFSDNGENQQQINDRGFSYWYQKNDGYDQHSFVMLDNGRLVQSEIPSNTNNPNIDMTGWIKTNDASFIIDGEKNQKQINSDQSLINEAQSELNNIQCVINVGVSSIAEMLSLTPKNGERVYVRSYHAGGISGGGVFTYNESLKTTNNGGTIINGWVRLNDQVITPQMFGAKADGVTDDKDAIQKAINTCKSVYFPYSTNGYAIASRIAIPNGTKLSGDERLTTIVAKTSGEWVFEIQSGNVSIENFLVNCNVGVGVGVFLFRTDLSAINRCMIRNIESTGSNYFAQDLGGLNPIVYLVMNNCMASLHRGAGISLTKAFAYIKLSHVTIDYVGSASRNHIAFNFVGNEGLQMDFCDVTGGLVDGTTTGNHGFKFINCIAVWMNNCMADTVGGIGFWLAGGNQYFYLNNCVSSLCGSHGFSFESSGAATRDIKLTNCTSLGRLGMGYAPSGANGYNIAAMQISFGNCQGGKNTGNGIGVPVDGGNLVVNGGIYSNNGIKGFYSDTVSGTAIVTGALFFGNTSGNGQLSNAYQFAASCQGNSGALINFSGTGSF